MPSFYYSFLFALLYVFVLIEPLWACDMLLTPTECILCPYYLLDSIIGTEITMVTGNDVDSGPALSYSLHLDKNSQGKFGIHRYSGRVFLTSSLDFEEKTWYTLTVKASDSKHQTDANLTVVVEDVNDNVPTFTQDLYQVCL